MVIFGVELQVLPLIEVIASVAIVFFIAGWAWTKGSKKSE